MRRMVFVWLISGLTALTLGACMVPGQTDRGDMPGMDQDDMPGMDHNEMGPDEMGDMDEQDMPGMDHGDMMQTDDPDRFDAQFIDGMIEHHEGAVDMAQQVLEESDRAALRALAEEIIAAQAREIQEMEQWRAAWFPDLEPTPGMDMDMGAMEISADESIPFDQRFLEAMISHHVGAIDMAEAALQISEREEIRTLAEAIIADQQAEIELMRGWLLEWYGIEE